MQGACDSDGTSEARACSCALNVVYRRLSGSDPRARSALRSRKGGRMALTGRRNIHRTLPGACTCRQLNRPRCFASTVGGRQAYQRRKVDEDIVETSAQEDGRGSAGRAASPVYSNTVCGVPSKIAARIAVSPHQLDAELLIVLVRRIWHGEATPWRPDGTCGIGMRPSAKPGRRPYRGTERARPACSHCKYLKLTGTRRKARARDLQAGRTRGPACSRSTK